MKKAGVWLIRWGLGLVAPVIFLVSSAAAQFDLNGANIEIIPPNPCPEDSIVIRISGQWRDLCIPSNPQVTIAGNSITIDTTGIGCPGPCGDAITPYDFTVPIGQLPEDQYNVLLTYTCVESEERQFSFTVVPCPIIPALTPLGMTAMALLITLYGIRRLRRASA